MHTSLRATASLVALAACAPAALAQTAPLTDIITVRGSTLAADPQRDTISPDLASPAVTDATALIARLPGADMVGNGALSGQVQYRGLFGPRINLRVNSQAFASGGPNLMDPPLQYAPLALVERIEVDRGISPVRSGPGLGGGMNAILKSSDFGDSETAQLSYDLALSGRTLDDSYAAGGLIGVSAQSWHGFVLASEEAGDDVETPLGTIGGSEHQRSVLGLGGGVRFGRHRVDASVRRHETGATGNPPFAMDIRYIDTDFAQLRYAGDFETVTVSAELGYADVAHGMNNFDLRPAPASPMRFRETFADAQSWTGRVDLGFAAGSGDLLVGIDWAEAEHDVVITNPNNASFFLTSVPDAEISRTGLFAEWTGAAAGWSGELGARVDWHEADAGDAVTGSAVPMMPAMLAAAFNAQDHAWDDTTLDAVARVWRPLSEATTLRISLARKTRVPGYLERFAWLPTPASGGLADGNTYVGDLSLDTETAYIVELGLDYQTDHAYLRPTLYHRRIDDFIQGVAFDATPGVIDTSVEMVSAMNGDPTPLRFANVDAEITGLDLDFGHRLNAQWRLDGVASWVEGERRDIDDNLYRIAPPSLTLSATRESADWSATLESVAFAEQDKVSVTNGEAETPGFVILNAYGSWHIRDGVTLSGGIENLLDHGYRQHLAGYNRNAGSDIGLGDRLPGAGRHLALRLTVRG